MQGQCHLQEVIYQASVTHTNTQTRKTTTDTYLGMTATSFKERHSNHKSSFKHKHKCTDTELSKHIWNLKEQGLEYDLQWRIIDKAKSFSPISKCCKLCTLERYYLIFRTDLHTLNKNTEFGHDCLHKRFLKLSRLK